MGWITLATRLRARGLKGEISADGLDTGPERYAAGQRVTLVAPGGAAESKQVVERVWQHQDRLVFQFEGIRDRTAAERFQGWDVCIAETERPPAGEGEYYLSDLVGCEVIDRARGAVGRVTAWQDYGAAPLLIVDHEQRELMVPFVKGIWVEVDLAGRRILVDLPEGLLDL